MRAIARRARTWANGLIRRDGLEDFDRPLRARPAASAANAPLPLVHVSTAWGAREIVRSAKFKTRRCDVFGVDLVYFFVLRPAYLSRFAAEKSHFLDYFPVAFVLRPDAVPDPYHVYPFDTGAAARGAFKAKANRLVPLEDYEIESSHEAAAGFIRWAFGELSSYYGGILRTDLSREVQPVESVATGYVAIAKMGVPGDADHDTRASTLEVTSSQNVDVPGNVMLIILPKQLLEDVGRFGDALQTLRDAGTDVEIYDWQSNRAPVEYQRDLMRIARGWYHRRGIEL